ncbi:prephenate dehydrogenase [Oikeobacillus pervagus]|uniref:Prephenate dehydrogenase n=1 Tax=Oikeobacillus pervagus TaxID=1325931 RepID=A0AAJ1SW34_9BACI|nr:prephenate dehydrogenase [Oikeobacillus pervagus]MDQ0213689.1 prephenate dehydrogenase [Oikeobacillus pervagus]
MERKVLVIGLGLIGGSLALAIKREHPNSIIVGYDKSESELSLAKALGVIDKNAKKLEDEAKEADLIILATPVMQTEGIIQQLATFDLKKDVIVTDTGSTKKRVMDSARVLANNGVTFIGGHPMAGSHKSGVTAAKEILFENAFYLLTPSEYTSRLSVETLKEWLKGTKSKMVEISPEEHDELTGVISHFPHVIAAALIHQAQRFDQKNSLVSRLAAGGFRDITRIASSNPEMWKDISLHNKEVLLHLLQYWADETTKVISLLENHDEEALLQYFAQAKKFRDQLPITSKGAIPSFYDLYVDVPDYPGVISEITAYLAEARISITNIRIIETREDVYGILVISFQNDEDRLRAKQCIENITNYDVFFA